MWNSWTAAVDRVAKTLKMNFEFGVVTVPEAKDV